MDEGLETNGRAMKLLELVSGTSHRQRILQEVTKRQPDLRTLADELDIPRTTLKHNLDKLNEHGLVENTITNEYRITAVGDIVLDGIKAYRDHVESGLKLKPLFSCISPTDIELDSTQLEPCNVTVSKQAKPYAPSERLRDLLLEAQSVDGFLLTLPPLSEADVQYLFDDSTVDVDLILPRQIVEVLYDEYETEILSQEKLEKITVSIVEQPINYSLVLVDGHVLIQGIDSNGKPHVLVETRGEDCRKWARETLNSLSSGSRSVERPNSPKGGDEGFGSDKIAAQDRNNACER